MSWSFSAIGKPPAVARAARAYIETGHRCAEPEETVRRETLETAAKVAESHSDKYVVSVECGGSMWTENGVPQTQNLRLEVKSLGNLVE